MRLKAKQEIEINVGEYSDVFKNINVGDEFECVPMNDGIKVDFGNGNLVSVLDNIGEIRKYFDLVD